ncbi:3-oxo-5-alpha-steroid 4-dehydrogenase-domain-containing protein [Microdochium trichocladiopsis]|uniref:3-oxo-5-alpha-steroid 4-dehydrogenase-domain-containing protein n=1 Tax=Microdochium trichocladiopsis TaxID=1682393 RepID=A0A9P8YHW6_9PEZI|nr:3-oxo-5-alpha-steroid 4-dehydrogenase-domain-containing protein [Microdochium trichocladiopsis]KAH7040699.1 3-oxo-5-alpha-steroid 4-dehydrogenase-domain-containing protein [Microdochium trichocladiopsis]
MAGGISLKVTNRVPKRPIKKLPSSIELGSDATVEDVKLALAKAAGIADHNRLGIYDPSTKKTLKDRKAPLSSLEAVVKHGEVLVKDMGPQVSWRTVFIMEYLGPMLFHPPILALRNYIYPPLYSLLKGHVPAPATELSFAQKAGFAMIMLHFLKREYETVFVHKFSAATMPVANIFWNSIFYWSAAGLLGAFEIYAPFSPAALAKDPITTYLGIALFVFGQVGNFRIHKYLSGLRKPGETDRKLPQGFTFQLVTCPNYMFEVIAWAGIIIATRSPSLIFFISIGIYYMWTWGWGKEKAYRKQFGDQYKKKRSVMLPGLL